MEHQDYSRTSKIKLFITQFLLPSPIELIPYFFASLFVLGVASNRTLLVILADGSPVTPLSVGEVFGQRLEYISSLLAIPILGRVVLFIFWLGIGSVVYMGIWVFQNMAIEVYDDVVTAKLKKSPAQQKDEGDTEGWWGTTLSHTLFFCSSILLFLFYTLFALNILIPAWSTLFQLGLQSLSEVGSIFKLLIAIFGTIVTLHIFILFYKLFMRLKNFIFNNYY